MGNDRLEDLPLDQLVIGKSQVRITQVGKGIAELAASIAKQGLLEPITVVASEDQPGKYEIIAGQRRFLAHKELNRETIRAVIRDEKVSETDKKVISLTENMLREDPAAADYILACTELYRFFGNLTIVSQKTGLPYDKVRQYVKFDRLQPEMKALVTDEGVDIKIALKAQDAITYAGEYDSEKAVELARSMVPMNNAQRERAQQAVEENPTVAVEQVVELARTAETEIVLSLQIQKREAKSLKKYASDEGTSDKEAAIQLVREGLVDKGYLTEDEE